MNLEQTENGPKGKRIMLLNQVINHFIDVRWDVVVYERKFNTVLSLFIKERPVVAGVEYHLDHDPNHLVHLLHLQR